MQAKVLNWAVLPSPTPRSCRVECESTCMRVAVDRAGAAIRAHWGAGCLCLRSWGVQAGAGGSMTLGLGALHELHLPHSGSQFWPHHVTCSRILAVHPRARPNSLQAPCGEPSLAQQCPALTRERGVKPGLAAPAQPGGGHSQHVAADASTGPEPWVKQSPCSTPSPVSVLSLALMRKGTVLSSASEPQLAAPAPVTKAPCSWQLFQPCPLPQRTCLCVHTSQSQFSLKQLQSY